MAKQSEFEEFGAAQFLRRKSASSITIPKEQPIAKSPDQKKPKYPNNLPSFPGDYEIKECRLYSPHKPLGGYIDLRQTFAELNIYEDIFSPTLQMDITLVDGIGLEELLPIMGEERISLEIKTGNMPDMSMRDVNALEGPEAGAAEEEPPKPGPFAGSENTGTIKLDFQIVKMSDRTELDNIQGMYRYTLHGVSKEYIDSCKTKVRRSTITPPNQLKANEPRKISQVIRKLFHEYFRNSEKKIFIEPTKNLTKIAIPNLPPFKAFEFLASRAVSAGQHAVGSSFVFYESTTGYHFVSLETLMAGGGTGYINPPDDPMGTSPAEGQYSFKEERSKETYTIWPKNMTDGTKRNWEQQAAMESIGIESFKFTSNFDILQNLTKGMYANKLLTHDIVRMKYDYVDFQYINPNDQAVETKVNNNGMVQDVPKALTAADKKQFIDEFAHLDDGNLCTVKQEALGAPEASINFYPTSLGHDTIPHFSSGIGEKNIHGGPKGPLNIVPNRVEQWMQQRIVQEQQLNNIKLQARAPGRSCRNVGDVIDFKMPSPSKKERGAQDTPKPSHPEHKYLSGKYLITKVKHNFAPDKYTIDFEAIKDSLKEQMPGTTSNPVEGSSAIMQDGTVKMSEDGSRVIGGF
tara:strand:+ start:1445 stop:3340 length:1896 start_codon:yes stop_codon:yes gene_type:complete